jgi:hypothetical protein
VLILVNFSTKYRAQQTPWKKGMPAECDVCFALMGCAHDSDEASAPSERRPCLCLHTPAMRGFRALSLSAPQSTLAVRVVQQSSCALSLCAPQSTLAVRVVQQSSPCLAQALHFALHCTLLYSALHSTLHCTLLCTALYSALHSALHCTLLCTALYPATSTALYSALHSTLHCTLFCNKLCTLLCTALYSAEVGLAQALHSTLQRSAPMLTPMNSGRLQRYINQWSSKCSAWCTCISPLCLTTELHH